MGWVSHVWTVKCRNMQYYCLECCLHLYMCFNLWLGDPIFLFWGIIPKSGSCKLPGKERKSCKLPSEIYSEDFPYLHRSVEYEILSRNPFLWEIGGTCGTHVRLNCRLHDWGWWTMNDFPFPPRDQMSNQRCLKRFESLMERLSQVTKMLFLICYFCDNAVYSE